MHRGFVAGLVVAALAAAGAPLAARAQEPAFACEPGSTNVVNRTYESSAARSYDYVEFDVLEGTTRIEVGYRWVDHAVEQGFPGNPITQTVFDLGLWEGTVADDSGFRGWSGSRQGRLDEEQLPVWIDEASAERGYLPGPIAPGSWFTEIGVAAVGPDGATVTLEISCSSEPVGEPFVADHVDPTHVANPAAGWYHGDFHVHGYHSNPNGPSHADLVAEAEDAGLKIVPITEYVTTQHWRELGSVQATNPDVLIWPGREIITYFGHAITLGKTPVAEYRHGYDGVTLRQIQQRIKQPSEGRAGLFGVAHPTIFPGPVFRNFCRGCEFELGEQIDWALVDTIEVVTGPALADFSDAHGAFPSTHEDGLSAQQPFIETAIDFWEERLLDGHKIAPVSGSDSKGVEPDAAQRNRKGYGSSATAVYANSLSVADVTEALEAGRVYVRTRGVDGSPALELNVRSLDGTELGTFGSEVAETEALMEVTIDGGAGQLLRVTRNGVPVVWLPIASDDHTVTIPIFRVPGEERPASHLGTFWRVDTLDARSLTTIGNAVFLTGAV